MRINAALVSVQDRRSGYAYGQLAKVPLQASHKVGLLRAGIPADVPDNAIITKAELVFHAPGVWSGSRTFSAQRNADGWGASKATWDNKPGVTGSVRSVTVGATVDGSEFRIDVSDHVQLFLSGAATNRGWRITTDDTSQRSVYGATASKHKPYLDFEWLEPGDPPVDLSPDGGAVSIAKPTLTFTVPDDATSIQVQIDAAADSTSPDWDSGEVFSTVGLLDLSTTTYPGLSLGASTSWRARYKGAFGWSAYSSWASFPRIAKPTVTITSPGATTGDRTPPITWTATGQVTWRAQLFDAKGKELDDSTKTSSSDTEWTPDKGLKRVGDTGRARVRVWDNVDRVASPGDPLYAEATLDFQLVAIGDAPGVDTLTAVQVGGTPSVRLAWSGAVADLWKITRDGEFIDELDGAESTYYDRTAAPLTQHVYQVLAGTDTGLVSPNGPTATITTRPAGVWLIDPETGDKILILDANPETVRTDQAIVHNIVGDRPPVRRRSGTPPPSGTVQGYLLDSFDEDYPALQLEATAQEWLDTDQGQVFRLVMGSWNIPVTIGDLNVGPALLDETGRPSFSISFAWWRTRWEDD